jgi:hypothetical protein
MRITALSYALICCLVPLAASAAEPDASPEPRALYTRIAKLASSLSGGEPIGAIASFDREMPGYASIAEHIQALTAQAEILCSIDIVADKEAGNPAADVHHLDLDWYMTLTSRAATGPVERRRLRVTVALRRIKTGPNEDWRIISLTPDAIFAPIAIPR